MTKVAINGMGRIGRAAFKIIMDKPELELVAVNDLMDLDNLVYLLNYDTVYGVYKHRVTAGADSLKVNGKTIKYLNVKDPAQLPWKDLGVEIVMECTGLFTTSEGLSKHVAAGRYKEILEYAQDEIVSSDIIMNPHASIFDPSMTQVVDGDLVKVMSWYDNEWGYTNQMIREAVRLAELG
jgi:glyceraldehyde-3-phosphate dehydrogenase/erythrose-4-phosphate dehydrogenase